MSGLLAGELVVDSFAGGGGASTGIEQALGRPVDIAINHDAHAIEMHRRNHPETKHYQEDIWKVDPREACASRPVGLLWASPDCTFHSRARGSKPVKKKIRGLAWVVTRWAKAVRPRIILLENVPEFEDWGPLDADDRPDKRKLGKTFRAFVARLSNLGYAVEWRDLVAADYGAPTTRKRLYLIARCDGQPIVWPTPTHGPGRPHAWRQAHEIIDWSLPCPSIFTPGRNLVEPTMMRVAKGVQRYVIGAAEPFIVRHGHYSTITGAGMREGCGAGTFRGQSLRDPLATVCATNDKHLVCPIITKHYGSPDRKSGGGVVLGHEVTRTLGTVTARDHHSLSIALLAKAGYVPDPARVAQVRAFLLRYNGTGVGADLQLPLPTVTALPRFGLVMVQGEEHPIADILMRMLVPRELYRAQGFADSYQIDGFTIATQIKLCGNSVSPYMSRAITAANSYPAREARFAS